MGFWFWVVAAMTLFFAVDMLRLLATLRKHTRNELLYKLTVNILTLGWCAMFFWAEFRAPAYKDSIFWYFCGACVVIHLVGNHTGHPDPFRLNEPFRWPWSRTDKET